MLSGPRYLALEVKYLPPARAFYDRYLSLPVRRETETEVVFAAGESELVLRAPSGVPRGGLHTHYAFSTSGDHYDDWWERLSNSFDLDEYRFGPARSLYFYDSEGNCVEIGERDGDDGGAGDEADTTPTVTGIFEIVFEVEALAVAEQFWTGLGFEVVDRGENRQRIRLTCGDLDVELWEPHLGLADARGGVHVDVGLTVDDPERTVARIRDLALAVEPVDDGWRVRDPDGHYVTLVE